MLAASQWSITKPYTWLASLARIVQMGRGSNPLLPIKSHSDTMLYKVGVYFCFKHVVLITTDVHI